MADTAPPMEPPKLAHTPRARLDATLLRILGLAFTVFIIAYIAIPVVVTLVMSFNEASVIRFPIKAWSFAWYQDFFASPQWVDALKAASSSPWARR